MSLRRMQFEKVQTGNTTMLIWLGKQMLGQKDKIETSEEKLIELYDTHNIFILPSFTEGHPMALLESLARCRPVIIFEEISHVVLSKKGIFIAKRNSESLLEKIEYIQSN